jgi:ParB-like nuclease domain
VEGNTAAAEHTQTDGDDDLDPIPTFEMVREQWAKRIAELKEGTKADRRLAAMLVKCRKGSRCRLHECPVCERRKKLAVRGVPANIIKTIGSLTPLITVYVKSIKVIGKRRPLVESKVRALAASIKDIGLLTPISVIERKKDVVLVSGLHRLEAVKRLGWNAIKCVVFSGEKDEISSCRLDENLYRAELTVLQRSEALKERHALILAKPQEVQVAPPGGHQPNDMGIKKAAKALGITREEVRRAMAIAGIFPRTKKRVCELGLDDNQQALVEISKQTTPEGQLRVVEEIIERKRAESARRGRGPITDQKVADTLHVLRGEVRQDTVTLAAKRKRLQVMEDKLAIQGEVTPPDETVAPTLAPLHPDDEAEAQAIVKALKKLPKIRAKLVKASPAVLDRVIAIIRAQELEQ